MKKTVLIVYFVFGYGLYGNVQSHSKGRSMLMKGEVAPVSQDTTK